MSKTKILAINSLLCAMSVAVMSLASVIETLDISLAVMAGLFVAVSETEFGSGKAWLVFTVSALLSFLLPQKSVAIFYVLAAGWYPIVQPRINLLKKGISLLVKFGVINCAITLSIIASSLFFDQDFATWLIASFYVLGNIAFYLYDLVLRRLILWYIVKLRNKLGFGK